MTTIAYSSGVLAGDQRLTEKQMVWHDKCRKVFKLKDGSLVGASGDAEAGDMLIAAMRKGILLPALPKDRDVRAIRVTPEGKIYIFEGNIWTRWPENHVAIGSGKRYALTALKLGHSAVEAVKMGIAFDVYSGGKVQTVKLGRRK